MAGEDFVSMGIKDVFYTDPVSGLKVSDKEVGVTNTLLNWDALAVGRLTVMPLNSSSNPEDATEGALIEADTTGQITMPKASVSTMNAGIVNVSEINGNPYTPYTEVDSGQFYKSSALGNQAVTASASPTTTTITFDSSAPWTGTAITKTNNTTFTVEKKGLYFLELNIQYGIGATAVFGSDIHFANIRLNRGGAGYTTIASISPNIAGYNASLPSTRAIQVQATFQLDVGDILQFSSYDWLTAGTWNIQPQTSGAQSYDYNTFWSYTLIKPLA